MLAGLRHCVAGPRKELVTMVTQALPEGLVPQAIGEGILGKLEEGWIASQFNLSREDLLARIETLAKS